MQEQQTTSGDKPSQSDDKFAVNAPQVTLPKGGGAIRGMGEKFAANPVTGTGSMSVPIATSLGRSGFGPQLSLSYDSGAGNGPFGFGWSLSLPSITRKTDKGLPQYHDAEESDVFILSGAEDLVPVLKPDGNRFEDTTTAPGYAIHRYRPRIEGLFARIERWTRQSDGDIHWRSISKDNILTLYGRDTDSRIHDPDDPTRIFSWLICETRDDKGNAVVYKYKPEDGTGVDLTQAHERNRGARDDARRTANRYLKRIHYGNRTTLLDNAGQRPRFLTQAQVDNAEWMFEVVFDYGEHDQDAPMPNDVGAWPCRNDPFSSYRSGFEVRTCRLCQRVLMFHHFEGEAGVGKDCLVRSTDFTYSYEENPNDARNPVYSFLLSVTQSGYKRDTGGYLKRSLPPVEFEYTQPNVQDTVEEVDPASLENLPIGVDGATYQWTDLHGEGIPGILAEQADAWFYKRNLSPINKDKKVDLAPLECVALKPNLALATGAQFMDLAGDGQPDLVVLDGSMPGLYEHDDEESWQSFRPFTSRLNRNTRDPNLKFIDLDGDGHADVLITEDDAFVWHASLAEAGFGPARRVAQALDEEKGPRLVFADGTQSIYLADLSGDGLTDIVRVRNGEVCYWPNLGYGRFGAKVTMDNAPRFDSPDQFDQKRIRLADIDGTGTTDIIYLHRDSVRLYFNQSGNSWSAPHILSLFPHADDLTSIVPADLLGNGTACLVWSSPLSNDARRQMRYVSLMGGQKPHLLIKTVNNLGAKTRVQYAPSTKFYLRDRQDGKLWITRLPFPVHVVEKVIVTDNWRNTSFSTTYTYHHGYFDGIEREFRGFGRVEQVDVESYGEFAAGNAASPYITDNKTLYQPPVKTVTWFHTGACLDRKRILDHFAEEYFPHWLDEQGFSIDPDYVFSERALPEPDLGTEDLDTDEWREAHRACKGMTLRQEVYELDVDSFEAGIHKPTRLFTAAAHNCAIKRLQPRKANRHAVFLVTESEAITYHYELDMKDSLLRPDPRIAHTLTLNINKYGQPLQTIAVGYRRVRPFRDDAQTLPAGAEALIRRVQAEIHLSYTEARYTDDAMPADSHRLPAPCEVRTYELTGVRPADAGDRATSDPWDDVYFTLDELRAYRLSERYQSAGDPVEAILYHQLPDPNKAQKRIVEHVRMLFLDENLAGPLAFGRQGRLGLPYETYKLALTRDLLDSVFGTKLTADVLSILDTPSRSGYVSGTALDAALTDQHWIRSGIAGFAPDAPQHFYLPERYTDPFGNVTTLEYDPRDLFIQSSTDARSNRTEVTRFDYRVLAATEMKDLNDNYSAVAFDLLGLPVASAIMGKNRAESGDSLASLRADLTVNEVGAFLTSAYDPDVPRGWLQNATARYVYDLGEKLEDGELTYGHRPAGACGIMREKHVNPLQGGENRIQVAVEYSDGLGAVLVKKAQAEPAPGETKLRWIATGKTVLNNKGKPVKQYEPYFSDNEHRFDKDEAQRETGVTPIMFYDAPGRLIRTELPDGSYSRVEFSPWHVKSFDQNDTILEPGNPWYAKKTAATATTEDKRAAQLAAVHAATPALTILDSLGREVIAITHNRVQDPNGPVTINGIKYRDENYLTFTKLDAEGKPLWIRDARGNLVMQYVRRDPPDPTTGKTINQVEPDTYIPCYDIAGNLLYQHSMDAGDRWMLMDAAGKPMLAWDFNQRQLPDNSFVDEQRLYFTDYDALHRPTALWLVVNGNPRIQIERYEYRDTRNPDGSANTNLANDKEANLIGQLVRHYDPSGRLETVRRDFKGNVREIGRRLNNAPTDSVIDWQNAPESRLEAEVFSQITEYDALNRMTRLFNWHRGEGSRVAVYLPAYSERGLLKSEQLITRARKVTRSDGRDDYDPVADVTSPRLFQGTRVNEAIEEVRYNAKGQKEYLELGNRAITKYDYDEKTFRLRQLRTTRPAYNPPFPQFRSNLADANVLQQLLYTYDPAGNITEIEDQAYKPVYFANGIAEPKSQYEYDALYRLIFASGRETAQGGDALKESRDADIGNGFPITDQTLRRYTQNYEYDSVGNFATMRHSVPSDTAKGWTRAYACATDSNRLLSTEQGGIITNYGYDTHGNMLNLANVAPGQHLQWDHRDMVCRINLIGGGTAYYQYDSGKQRTRKRIVNQNGLGGYWERIYLGGYERYRRYNGNGSTLVEEIESHHLFEGEQRVLLVDDVITTDRTQANGTPFRTGPISRYQYSNHLGSACLELDHQADVISYEEYHPYGTSAYRAMKSGTEAPQKRYRYTGMERDEESGLGYHAARYYVPWLGRWTSCDSKGIAQGTNLYAYARDCPTRFIDDDGRAHRDPNRSARLLSPQDFVGLPSPGTAAAMVDLVGPQIMLPVSPPVGYNIADPEAVKAARAERERPTLDDPSRERFEAFLGRIGPGTPSQNRMMQEAMAVPVLGLAAPEVAVGLGSYATVLGYDALFKGDYDLAKARFGLGLGLLTAAKPGFEYNAMQKAYANVGPLQDRLRAAVIGERGYLNRHLTISVAVGRTEAGAPVSMVSVNAGAGAKLSQQVRLLAEREGAIFVEGAGHAEANIYAYAKQRGLTGIMVDASNPHCVGCTQGGLQAGVQLRNSNRGEYWYHGKKLSVEAVPSAPEGARLAPSASDWLKRRTDVPWE